MPILTVRTAFLIPPSSTGSPEDEGIWNLCKALFKTYVQDRDKPIRTVKVTGLRENFGRDDGIEEPYRGPSSESQTNVRKFTKAKEKN